MLFRALALASTLAALAPGQSLLPLDTPEDAGPGLAFDSARQRVVVFGTDGETWEVDGTTRLHRAHGSSAPSPRQMPAVEFDPVRGHTLLFGGAAATSLADTWTWDGNRWQQRAGIGPPARHAAGIAFDTLRGRMIVFGGQSRSVGVLADTWEHDGSQWIQRTPATVPPTPNEPVMTFDSARGVTVMGLASGFLGAPMATWEWNGVDWTQRAIGQPAPLGGTGTTMAFDPLRQRCVLLGGGSSQGISLPGQQAIAPGREIWEWNGSTWTQAATLPITLRRFCKAWFDPRRGAIVVVGGTETFGDTFDRLSWSWNGASLQVLASDQRPARRFSHAWFSEPGGSAITFGGQAGGLQGGPQNDTWRWNGQRWARVRTTFTPPPRSEPATASDPLQTQALLFGGASGATPLADFWRWNGIGWTALPGGPAARYGAGMATNPFSGQVVLFGGANGPIFQSASLLGDTWLWNGTTWSQATVPGPSPRHAPAIGHDLLRNTIVLFGGRVGPTLADQLNDTWEWNGVQWSRRLTVTTPPPLLSPSLDLDVSTTTMALVGQTIPPGAFYGVEEIWDFDGVDWRQRSAQPIPLSHGRVIADWSRGVLVGYDGSTVYEWTSRPADAVTYGAGCGNPTPRLAMRARPRLLEPQSGLELFTAPSALALFAVDAAPGSVPLGNGCTLLLGGVAFSAVALADPDGTAVLPWSVPASPTLSGSSAFAQAAVFAPQHPGGLTISAGLRFTIGD